MRRIAVLLAAVGILVPLHDLSTTPTCSPPSVLTTYLGGTEELDALEDDEAPCNQRDRQRAATGGLFLATCGALALIAWKLPDRDELNRST